MRLMRGEDLGRAESPRCSTVLIESYRAQIAATLVALASRRTVEELAEWPAMLAPHSVKVKHERLFDTAGTVRVALTFKSRPPQLVVAGRGCRRQAGSRAATSRSGSPKF